MLGESNSFGRCVDYSVLCDKFHSGIGVGNSCSTVQKKYGNYLLNKIAAIQLRVQGNILDKQYSMLFQDEEYEPGENYIESFGKVATYWRLK